MKTFLLVATLSLIGASQADAAAKMICTDTQSGKSFSVFTEENKNTGKAMVKFSDGQKLGGVFKSGIVKNGTRLSGATILDVKASYGLPDYSKPHDISISVVGSLGQLSGHAELTNLTGQVLSTIFIDCKAQNLVVGGYISSYDDAPPGGWCATEAACEGKPHR